MPASVNIAGTWKAATAFVNVAGTWKAAPAISTNIAGTWKSAYTQKVATPSIMGVVPIGSPPTAFIYNFGCSTSGATIQTSTNNGGSWVDQSSITVPTTQLSLQVRAMKTGWTTSGILIVI